MTTKRTTHRSTAGTKLLAKRKPGQFTDIQTHRRSSRVDQRVTTVEEATRVLVREARAASKLLKEIAWEPDNPSPLARMCRAYDNLNSATRAAAKRKRARSVKP